MLLEVVHDCELYYEIFGEDKEETMIMLHGNGEDSRYFAHQTEFFKKYMRVVVVDMRGHGKSKLGSRRLDFRLFADDVVALMDHLHIDQAHMLGFSDGGNTAIQLGLHHASRVQSLVLNGANLSPRGIKLYIQIPIMIGYAICSLFHSDVAKHRQQVLQLMIHHPHVKVQELATIQAPVLVLTGTKDMVRNKHSERMTKAFPHAMHVVLNGTHFIAQDCPDVYNASILHFLQVDRKCL